MSDYFHTLTHKGIQSLHPYIPGKAIEELAREKQLTDIIKLASNENPLGCSPLAQQALANLTSYQLALYPSPSNHPLYSKLAEHLGIDRAMLMLSNGSDYIFWFLLTIFALNQNKFMLTHQYAFITYSIQAQIMGIPILTTPVDVNFEVNIDEMIEACLNNDVALIFLANPNNPTGLGISHEQIERLLSQVPTSTLVVVDEAYHEYTAPHTQQHSLILQQRFANLILTRTFSKVYGLAALRLGYAIAHPSIIELLHRVQLPFTVNQAALVTAQAALADKAFIQKTLECNREGMQQMSAGLKALDLSYIPSQTNFITFECKTSGQSIYDKLLEQGIIVRPLTPYGLPNHLRVTIGTAKQNERFLANLAKIL